MISSMRICQTLFCCLFLCSVSLGQLGSIGQLGQAGLVQFHLLMDTGSISPGKPFRLGMVYDISPGWHIYWINPGDAGLATSVKLHLPAGFTASPIVFPVPTQFVLPGGINCYGYNSRLMLITTITPPADLKVGPQVSISADTSYLVCEQVCIGGKQTASDLFSTGIGSGARNVDLFDHWSSLIPVPARQSPLVKSVSFDDSSVNIGWTEPVTRTVFFPGPSGAVSLVKIDAITEGKQTQVLFVPKYYDKTKLSPISCVVGFLDSHGLHRAIQFPITLKGNG